MNSYLIGVFVSTLHPSGLPIEELLKQCSVKRTRGSGPGGQHRNKVETAIVITHEASKTIGQASEERSQHRNREIAIQRLRLNLAVAVRCPRAVNAKPSELWRSRVKARKVAVSQSHFDFAPVLAESLDIIFAAQFEMKVAAESLGVSTSQLTKLVKTVNAAFELINAERQKLNLHRLS